MGIVLRARGPPVLLRAVLVRVLRARVPPYLYGESVRVSDSIAVLYIGVESIGEEGLELLQVDYNFQTSRIVVL